MLGLLAQDKITTFNMSYFDKQPIYDVQATESGDFYISFFSLDALSSKAGIIIKSKDLADFKTRIDSARAQYTRWSTVAKENGVTEVDKQIGFYGLTKSYFLYGGKWHFDESTTLKLRYKILSANVHALIITTGELTASDNQYMDIDGLALVFISSDEIAAFLLALDPQKVIDHYEQKKKQGELFK